jgi:DNA-binding NtrC family response regulator
MSSSDAKSKILVIDDDPEIRYTMERVLSVRGYEVVLAGSGEEGLKLVKKLDPEVVLLDIRMGGMSGLETLQHIRGENPRSMVILMTAFGTTQTAIEAMKYGAYDYVIKPFDLKKILGVIENAFLACRDLRGASRLSYEPLLDGEDYKEGIVGSSEVMQEVFKIIGQVASSDATVMITGESGTGKELVAKCLFQHSLRSDRIFVPVNCAAIPEALIESELFGHEKGAFTGANNQRIGKFELCNGGTLFLDEIGDMTLSTQAKILRAIQEGEIQRVGGNDTFKVNVRLIAATHRNLEELVKKGTFREDLYYRLNVVRIKLPSLRERAEDIPQLVDYMLQKIHKEKKTRARAISPDALANLCKHKWVGNVRELENVIYRSAVIARGETILIQDLPREMQESPGSNKADEPSEQLIAPKADVFAEAESRKAVEKKEPKNSDNFPLIGAPIGANAVNLEDSYGLLYKRLREKHDKQLLQVVEEEIIKRALDECGGNQVKTSALLGITRATLRKRIEEFGLKY